MLHRHIGQVFAGIELMVESADIDIVYVEKNAAIRKVGDGTQKFPFRGYADPVQKVAERFDLARTNQRDCVHSA